MVSTKRAAPLPHTGGFDLNDPVHRAAAVTRLVGMGFSLPRHLVEEGADWYPEAQRNVVSTARDVGMPFLTATGITAALSPASDWSSRNIPAVGQAASLRKRDWNDILAIHGETVSSLHRRRAEGTATSSDRPSKDPRITDLLNERGATALSGSSVPQLLRAHRMIQGAHPLDVLTRETSPKTRAFYTGLAYPHHQHREIPIDYRAYDLIANEMRPQNTERSLDPGSYARSSLGLTRYEHAENIIAEVGHTMRMLGGARYRRVESPLHQQAFQWVGGKQYELHMPGSKASRIRPGERHSGPSRVGQAYTDPSGNFIQY